MKIVTLVLFYIDVRIYMKRGSQIVSTQADIALIPLDKTSGGTSALKFVKETSSQHAMRLLFLRGTFYKLYTILFHIAFIFTYRALLILYPYVNLLVSYISILYSKI